MLNDPAFPCDVTCSAGVVRGVQTGQNSEIAPGLSKREWFAGMALQGVAANQYAWQELNDRDKATNAVKLADLLIEELSKVAT